MKTSELTGAALDWAVAKCEGVSVAMFADILRVNTHETHYVFGPEYNPSTNWSQGGPIIEREKIAVDYDHDVWNATVYGQPCYFSGPTPLIVAMRCYVASKLGDEVDVPEELKK